MIKSNITVTVECDGRCNTERVFIFGVNQFQNRGGHIARVRSILQDEGWDYSQVNPERCEWYCPHCVVPTALPPNEKVIYFSRPI